MVVVWEVVGGADKGGILVRTDCATTSPAEKARLSTGALVKELMVVGDRLAYEKLSGDGPAKGWVSVRLPGVGGKDLLVRTNKGPPPAPAEPPGEDDAAAPAAHAAPAEGDEEEAEGAVGSPAASIDMGELQELLSQDNPNELVRRTAKLLEARPGPSAVQGYRLRKLQLQGYLHPRFAGRAPARKPSQLAQGLAEQQPSDTSMQCLLGRALFMDGKKKEADEVWRSAAQREGVGSEGQRLVKSLVIMEDEKARGNVAFKDGNWDAACKAYTRALDADPYRMDREMSAAILGNRSAAYRKLMQFAEALADAEESKQVSPSYSKAKFRRGLALLELERYDEGLAELRAAKVQDPKLAGIDDWIERAQHWSFVKPQSHYVVLGVPIDASQDDIKKAHKRMALKWHPDKASADDREECERRFKAVQEAFEAISDDKQREIYDFGRIKPPPAVEKPMPKRLVQMGYTVRKGDGVSTCMICGFRVPPELGEKQAMMKRLHIQDTGHPGFYDK